MFSSHFLSLILQSYYVRVSSHLASYKWWSVLSVQSRLEIVLIFILTGKVHFLTVLQNYLWVKLKHCRLCWASISMLCNTACIISLNFTRFRELGNVYYFLLYMYSWVCSLVGFVLLSNISCLIKFNLVDINELKGLRKG